MSASTRAAPFRRSRRAGAREVEGSRGTVRQRIARDRTVLLLMLPGVLFFLLFAYLPLLGNIVAFQVYQPFLGFRDSPWTGLDNFRTVFADAAFWDAVVNTLQITLLQLVLFFPAPILLALLLNSVLHSTIRQFVQTVVYLPHFLGWVVIVSISSQVLGGTGPAARLLGALGVEGFDAMTDPGFFPFLATLQVIWRDTGWGTIIFLAALSTIDSQLYEAAAVDGAGRWRRFVAVTLPGILPVGVLLLVLNLGNLLNVGFEQIVLQRNNVGPAAGEVLDTYVYFHGLVAGQWGPSAAVGLVKAVVAAALVFGANKVAHLFGQGGIYQR